MSGPMSPVGPSRHFATLPNFVRYRGIADIVRTVGYAFRLSDLPPEASASAENSPLCPTGKSSLQARPVRAHKEGRIAIVTKTLGADAVAGVGAIDEALNLGRRSRVGLMSRR